MQNWSASIVPILCILKLSMIWRYVYIGTYKKKLSVYFLLYHAIFTVFIGDFLYVLGSWLSSWYFPLNIFRWYHCSCVKHSHIKIWNVYKRKKYICAVKLNQINNYGKVYFGIRFFPVICLYPIYRGNLFFAISLSVVELFVFFSSVICLRWGFY